MSTYFDDNKPLEGHGQKSLRGGAISIAARAINALIQIGSILFLARLLSPEDYGLVSMVTAVTGFAPLLVDLGTRDAIVQRERITPSEVSALFWLTILTGSTMALAMAACAPLVARFYGEPRLTAIVVVSSLTWVASALFCQHYALMRRAMQFRQLGVIELVANVASVGIAIVMAFRGCGYWTLVMRPILHASLISLGVWLHCHWLPGQMTITPTVKDMIRFGTNSVGFTATDFAAKNMDRVAIGIRSGAQVLGYYQNALTVYDNLLDLTFPLHNVAVASLSKLKDNPDELKKLWSKAISTLAFYAMPAFGILAVTAQDVVVLLLGQKWSSAGVLLSVLALRGIPHVVERTLGWLHVAAGRTDRWMRWGVVIILTQVLALFSGLPFGPIGIVCAYVICMYMLFVPAISYAGHPLGIGASLLMKAVGAQFTGALCAASLGFFLRYRFLAESRSDVRVILLVLSYLSLYLLLTVVVLKVKMPVRVVWSLCSGFVSTRLATFRR